MIFNQISRSALWGNSPLHNAMPIEQQPIWEHLEQHSKYGFFDDFCNNVYSQKQVFPFREGFSMKKKLLLLLLMTIIFSNSTTRIHAASQEDVGYGVLGGLVLGALGGWAITYIILSKKHEQELLKKDSSHQKAIDTFNEDMKSLRELLNKQNVQEKSPQEIFGQLAL